MGISLVAYRATIGIFDGRKKDCSMSDLPDNKFNDRKYFSRHEMLRYTRYCMLNYGRKLARDTFSAAVRSGLLIVFLIILSGNVHPNPGPFHDITISHTNIRSLKAENRLTHIKCDLLPLSNIIKPMLN